MHRLLPSWPLLVALGLFAWALETPLGLLGDPDTYLHLAAGRWMLAHAALPMHDPFSYTMSGAYWTTPEWLAELLLAAAYRIAGWTGIALLTAACFALTFAILTRYLLRYFEPFSAMIATVAGAALLQPHLLARPHLLALPLVATWCGALFAARDDGRAPPFHLLPLIVLWANLHASFLFGVALAGYLTLEAALSPGRNVSRMGEVRRWGLFTLTTVLAGVLTPHGLSSLLQPFRLLAMPALQSSFIEWQSPDFQHFLALDLWFIAIIALGFGLGVRPPLSRLILLLVLCHETLLHARYVDLLALVPPLALAKTLGPPITAWVLAEPVSALGRGARRLARPAAAPGIALILAALIGVSLPVIAHPLGRADGPATPAKALAAAERLGVSGRVFNSERFGGYLIFRGIPVFIDGRIEMYGNAFLARYLKAREDPRVLEAILDRYDAAWALLSAQGRLARFFARFRGWRRAYADATAVIYVRTAGPGNTRTIH